jgi:hypothetical protein
MTVFNIYTTGIADITTNTHDKHIYGLLDIWIDTTCNNICKIIPPNITSIIISHYDPIIYAEHYNINISNTISAFNNQLINSINHLDNRIQNHTFNARSIDMRDLSYPHLIIDMAHIFKYGIGKTVGWSNHYSNIYTNPQIRLESIPIKAIYIPWNNSEFVKRKLIEISPNGNVRTYIDCMEDSGFITDYVYDPVDLFYNIVNKIRLNHINIWREAKDGVKSSDLGGKFDEIYDKFHIVDQLFDKLFLNKTKEEILDISTYDYYDEFKLKLLDPSYF